MSHYCEFCGTQHSSMSCYHPARIKFDRLRTEIAVKDAEIERLNMALDMIAKERDTALYGARYENRGKGLR
ncbi:MAG: hypothetical protein E4H07_04965 [Nitrosomonadales bacterium]|nr:MAG: hypothetical protein E4H07_04965 [Nitrosomonadales bacterium]